MSNSFIDNVGSTHIWGVELEGSAAFGEHTTAGASYSYTNSEIQEYVNEDQADLLGSNGTEVERNALGSVAGHATPRVPEHMLSLWARYERPFGNAASWFIGGDFLYESAKYAQVHNLIENGDRNLLGLQAGVNWGAWSLMVWGKNVTDDDTPIDVLRYIDRSRGSLPGCATLDPTAACTNSSPSTSPRAFGLSLPRKRQIGATLAFRFGS